VIRALRIESLPGGLGLLGYLRAVLFVAVLVLLVLMQVRTFALTSSALLALGVAVVAVTPLRLFYSRTVARTLAEAASEGHQRSVVLVVRATTKRDAVRLAVALRPERRALSERVAFVNTSNDAVGTLALGFVGGHVRVWGGGLARTRVVGELNGARLTAIQDGRIALSASNLEEVELVPISVERLLLAPASEAYIVSTLRKLSSASGAGEEQVEE
jgi:hypothetical protein